MGALSHDYSGIVAMYEADGLSVGQIAARYGVTRQAMHSALKRRGCAFRPQLRFGVDNHFHRGGTREDECAHNQVEYALRTGGLARAAACEDCGGTGRMRDGRTTIQAHHDDYNAPLAVRWLCQECHHDWHSKNRAVPRNRVVK